VKYVHPLFEMLAKTLVGKSSVRVLKGEHFVDTTIGRPALPDADLRDAVIERAKELATQQAQVVAQTLPPPRAKPPRPLNKHSAAAWDRAEQKRQRKAAKRLAEQTRRER
jgi:hypothetical protein